MAKLELLIIHCSATPQGRHVSSAEIRRWHLQQRKWSVVGYADMIHLDGELENLVEYDQDPWVEAGEITNGALGYNGKARHICIVGGQDKQGNNLPKSGDFDNMLTPEQFLTLDQYVKDFLYHHPECKVAGHNQVNDHKDCPGYDVPKFLRFIGIKEENIYNG